MNSNPKSDQIYSAKGPDLLRRPFDSRLEALAVAGPFLPVLEIRTLSSGRYAKHKIEPGF
jgi:hypothetical protein